MFCEYKPSNLHRFTLIKDQTAHLNFTIASFILKLPLILDLIALGGIIW